MHVALELATALGPDSTTEREAVVKQRIGQQMFRNGLMTLWHGRCAISGLDVPELLRASHAKPWAAGTDEERLDFYNGLLLSANLDAASTPACCAWKTTARCVLRRNVPSRP